MQLSSHVNQSLYMASLHMLEASKYMKDFNQEKSDQFLMEASAILSIVRPEVEKVSEEKLDSILGEILNFEETK